MSVDRCPSCGTLTPVIEAMSPQTHKVLDAIYAAVARGDRPNYPDLARELGRSKSTIYVHVQKLKKTGYVKWTGTKVKVLR